MSAPSVTSLVPPVSHGEASPHAEAAANAPVGLGGVSEFEEVRRSGFRGLTFPADMDARYQADKAPARLVELRWAALLFIVLNLGIFSADWLMVPDQFRLAVGLRLLGLVPLALICMAIAPRLGIAAREWLGFVMSTAMVGVGIALSLSSADELAPAYLVALEMVFLFNSGVLNMRMRMQMRASAVALLMFGGAVWALRDPPMVIMAAMALVLVATALYTLVGAYRLEREDRLNWLMLQHERVLLAELQRENARLGRLSRFDPLTGLANRRYADEFLAKVWDRCRHAGEDVAVLMIDIDHFKRYNDHLGHQEGDACLQAVATSLQGLLRNPDDMVARFGGEEFIAVLPRSSLPVALAAAERLREDVALLNRPHAASPTHKIVTLSIGVASVPANTPGAHPARLIAAADEALYQAKSRGRNSVVAFEGASLPAAHERDDGASPVEPARKAPDRERQEVASASAVFEKSDWALRFPAALEQQFLNQVALRLHYFSVSGLLSLLVFNGFLLVDYMMIPDVFWLAVQLRLIWFTPFALAIQFAIRYRREWVLHHFSAAMVESVIFVRSVLTAACLAYLLAVSENPLGQYYYVGLVVIVVYVNTIQRLRFWYAVAFSFIVLGMDVAGALMLPAFNPRLTLPITLLLSATVLFTLMPVYALERDERRRYLLTRRHAHLLEDLADVQQRLQTLSSTDALTGLSNRRHLQERLHQLWLRAGHDGANVSILMLDVDHFKSYNDHYGHPAGDRCLIQVAQALSACARGPSDIVARFGGEEFIVVLPGADGPGAQRVAERIRHTVETLQIEHAASTTGPVVTVSVGAACCRARPDAAESSLISAADAALYDAKQAGRNRVHLNAMP